MESFHELFEFKLKDVSYNLVVHDEDEAMKMRNDANYARQVFLTEYQRLQNETAVSLAAGAVEVESAPQIAPLQVAAAEEEGAPRIAPPAVVPSNRCKIKFTNLGREPFMEQFFVTLLEKARQKVIYPKLKCSVVSCQYEKSTRSVVVEFISEKIAATMLACKSYKYMHTVLQLEGDASLTASTHSAESFDVQDMRELSIDENVDQDVRELSTDEIDVQDMREVSIDENDANGNNTPHTEAMPDSNELECSVHNEHTITNMYTSDTGNFTHQFNYNVGGCSTPVHADLCSSPLRKKKDLKPTPQKGKVLWSGGAIPKGSAKRLSFQASVPNVKIKSKKVLVSGLPENFKNDVLLGKINQELASAGFCTDKDKPAACVTDQTDTTATVEFTTVNAAEEVCSFTFILKYNGNLLLFLHLEEPSEQRQSLCRVKTTNVLVSGLPVNFKNDALLDKINTELANAGFCMDEEEPAECVIDQTDSTATVKFTSVGAAEKVCSFTLKYKANYLSFEHLEESTEKRKSLNMLKTTNVLVSGLPVNFKNDALLDKINTELANAGFCTDEEEPAECVIDQTDSTATVKFTSVGAAEKVCSFTLKYKANYLSFEHLEEPSEETVSLSMVKTTNVLVSGLPVNFKNDALLDKINTELANAGFCMDEEEPAECVIDQTDSTATVKFTSVGAAEKVCSFTLKYKANYLSFEHLEEPADRPTQDQKKAQVLVSGLPINFLDHILLSKLNDALVSSGFCGKDDSNKPAVAVVSKDLSTATVEFSSTEAAKEVCFLGNLFYRCNELKLEVIGSRPAFHQHTSTSLNIVSDVSPQFEENIENDLSKAEYLEHSSLKDSCYVAFKHIASGYDEVSFKSLLKETLVEAFPETADYFDIQSCKHFVDRNAVIVEFSTCELANLAVLSCRNLEYKKSVLLPLKIQDASNLSFANDDSENEDSAQTFSLKDEQGTEMFIKLLIKNRENFPSSGSHDNILTSLRRNLAKKGVCASVGELRSKRTRLREKYKAFERNDKKGNPLYLPLSVVFGKVDDSNLHGTKWEISEDESDVEEDESAQQTKDLIELNDSSSWTIPGIKCLLHILFDHKEELVNHLHNIRFWRKISLKLGENKFYHSHSKCKARWDKLKAEYTKFVAEGERTGAPGPLESIKACKDVYEIMLLTGEVLSGNVAVRPSYVLGAGAHTVEKKAAVGRTRPTVLKGKALKRQVQEEREERKVQAEEKRNEVLEGILKILK